MSRVEINDDVEIKREKDKDDTRRRKERRWGWREESIFHSRSETLSPRLNRLLVFLCKILEQKLATLRDY